MSQPRVILHIITRLILGGAQQNTIMSCTAQVAAGHKVILAYGPIYGPEGSLLEEAKKSGAELVEVHSMRRAILPWHDWRCYHDLRALIRKHKPDIVHTHSSKAGIVGRAAAWDEKVPAVIHTVHGLPYHERQLAIVRNLYIGLERWAAKRCHKILGVTDAMCESFKQNHIGRPDMFAMVPSGIDLSLFQVVPGSRERVRNELGLQPQTPVLGICARLDKLKGQEDLVEIMPELIKRVPGIRLLIVGGGWYREALDAQVKKLGVGERVIFTGLVPPANVPEYLAAMDVKSLPSYQEGQPRTMVQALLCGCAIVGYDAGGIGEICIDGQTGKLVPVGNHQALADAITWMFEHPDQRKDLADRGKKYALERFDHRYMIRRLEEIYTEVLSASGKVSR